MERFILPEGNHTIGLLIIPYSFPCVNEGERVFVVEIRIIYRPHFYWLAPVNEEQSILLCGLACEEEFNLRMDEFISEMRRAKETASKIYKAVKAGRVTKEFFYNQEVDAE